MTGEPHRDPTGPGFVGTQEFTYKVEYGVFRPDMIDAVPHNLRGTFDYPEEAQAYIDQHPGYEMAVRRVPAQPPWEFL